MRRFQTLRGRLTAIALLAAAAAITVLTVAFNVVLTRRLDADADARLRSQAAAASTTVAREDGRIVVHESPDDEAIDRQVWIYAGTRALERPVASVALQRSADALAGRSDVFTQEHGGRVRLYAAPLTENGRQIGTVVAAESLDAYHRTTRLALVGSIALGAVLLAAVFGLTWLIIGRALHPVREMTRSAAEWTEHDPRRRFGATPRPDELGELARTFDALLDRLAASLRHEQRLSAELSHELRTPLARIMAEVELLQRRERSAGERSEAHAAIGRNAEQMSGILETLMAAARAEAHLDTGRSEVGGALSRAAADLAGPARDGRIAVDVRAPEHPLMAGVDAEVVDRIVAPLIDNAARHARARVTLSAARAGGRVIVSVRDDGPGVEAEDRDLIFEPGRGSPGANGHRGAGLGLALARRLARAAGGDVTLAPGAAGAGAEFRVELPT
jgi:signal transduction histidine kinase